MTEIPQDAEVRVYHYRPAEGEMPHLLLTRHEMKEHGLRAAPKGGITRVSILTPSGDLFIGQAQCSPRDNFSRNKGRMIATGRALAKYERSLSW